MKCGVMVLSARLGSDKYKVLSHWFDSTRDRTHGFESEQLAIPPGLAYLKGSQSLGDLPVAVGYTVIIYVGLADV